MNCADLNVSNYNKPAAMNCGSTGFFQLLFCCRVLQRAELAVKPLLA